MWCDDTCGLQKARGAKVDAFRLLDLLAALHGDGVPFDLAAIYQRLVGHYVMDLPLTAEGITTLAATQDWLPGPAHTTLARPGWWSHHRTGWEDPWLRIATQARAHSPQALTTITKAALTGALQPRDNGGYTREVILACRRGEGGPPRVCDSAHLGRARQVAAAASRERVWCRWLVA